MTSSLVLTCIPLPGPIWLIWLKFVGAEIIFDRLSVGRTALLPSLKENLRLGLAICLPLASKGVKFSSSPTKIYNVDRCCSLITVHFYEKYNKVNASCIFMHKKYTYVDVNC